MKKPLALIAAGFPLFLAQIIPSSSIAWQGNFPNSPVRTPTSLRLHVPAGAAPVSSPSLQTTISPFQRRTVAYPEPDGLGLSTGWDFLLNEKKFASCVVFVSTPDNQYQNLDLKLSEILDSETLDYSINAQFSGSVGGNIEGIEAKAQATTTIDASHHMATSDRVFIVSASITSGVIYTGASGHIAKKTPVSVQLTPDMADLAANMPDKFYEVCGHGFVSSIGSGAELYIMMHFHDLTTEDRASIDFDSKASAGLEDVFSAAGSSTVRAKIDDLIVKNELDISIVQRGGKISEIPITLDEAIKKVRSLATEETAGPRPMYITVTPYTELANWPGSYLLDSSDLRQRSIRYYKRLSSLFFEILNIRKDYFHDRYDVPKPNPSTIAPGDKYYYSYHHNLRTEDFRSTADLVKDQMVKVADLLVLLDKPDCKPKAISATIPESLGSPAAVKAATAHLRSQVAQLVNDLSKDTGCVESVKAALKAIGLFDDYQFMLTLPVPRDIFFGTSISDIEDPSRNIADRSYILAQYVFRHWIERPNQIRCRLYFECLSQKDLDGYSQAIAARFAPSSNTALALGGQCSTGANEQTVHVQAGYDVVVSDAHRDTVTTAYTLSTQDVPNGAIEVQLSNVQVGGLTQRLRINSRGSPFDIIVHSAEGIGFNNPDLGTCAKIGDDVRFQFRDHGEGGNSYNTEINLKAVIGNGFP